MEKLRFQWRFEYDVSRANPGGAIGVNLYARQISKSQNCGTATASISLMSVNGSSPFTPEETRLMDGERFVTDNGLRVWAADGQSNGMGSVLMRSHPAYPGLPYAFFTFDISVRGRGYLRYVYLYGRIG